MHGTRLIGCALALAALFLVSSARADEYTKLTYLTFSGPVQLPGITLPGGTYMFKLADPDSGRRVLQVWDKDGMKLYTTLLTIPDERMEATDKPVVMFSERPAGQPQAIKSWFYPDERIGQEFVYPKSQAMQIAKENHAAVLSYSDDAVKDSDAAALRSAKIGRLDENGQVIEDAKTAENHANDNAAQSSNAAVSHDNAPNNQAPAPAQAASTTTAPAAATTAADNDDAASSTATRAGATTARADNSQSNDNNAAAPAPSANRTQSAAPVGTSGTTAQSSTASQSDRAVGTSGTTADSQRNANVNNNRANQSDRGSNAAAPKRTLPKTASPLASIELLSALSLLGGLGVHQLRKRTAESRA
jgi:hypothetical protein